jgi:flagellar protein FlaJ
MAQIWKQAPGGFLGQAIDIDAITRVFYHMANIEAFVGGLVAGKMGEASTGAGLKHSLILMVAAYLIFYLYVW